jgi:hypothetical protein
MATWTVHLRIAQKFIDSFPFLDKKEFIAGSLAPDCGYKVSERTFNPPPKVTHFSKTGMKNDCDYKEFANKYLLRAKNNKEHSFYLGYYTHLLTDILWSFIIYVPTYDMYIRGENVGGWGLKDEFKFATTDEEYYVIEFAEPMELTGTFKLASTKWEDYDFPNYIYGGAEDGVIVGEGETTLTQGNGSKNLTFADGLLVSKIEFVRSTGVITITVATATDLEDVDAEDAIIAAYDITGKPVAADAAGIVILQYASGKAVKVFNN